MADIVPLRPVEDDRPALSREELQARGNELAGQARRAAVDAVRESIHSEFLEKGLKLQRTDIVRWRSRARRALEAWREVESLTTELLNEIERTSKSGGSL